VQAARFAGIQRFLRFRSFPLRCPVRFVWINLEFHATRDCFLRPSWKPTDEINWARNGHFEKWSSSIQPQSDPFGQLSPKVFGLILRGIPWKSFPFNLAGSTGQCNTV
jgi:hypothetical protein